MVSETEREIVVRAELPGLDPADVEVTVQQDALVVSGEKRESREEGTGPYRVSDAATGLSAAPSPSLPARIRRGSRPIKTRAS